MPSEGQEQTDTQGKSPSIIQLSVILSKEQGRAVDYSEAKEIGEALLYFYEILSDSEAIENVS